MHAHTLAYSRAQWAAPFAVHLTFIEYIYAPAGHAYNERDKVATHLFNLSIGQSLRDKKFFLYILRSKSLYHSKVCPSQFRHTKKGKQS